MDLLQTLNERSASSCELCFSTEKLASHKVLPERAQEHECHALLCEKCLSALGESQSDYWQCLKESIWSVTPVVQVLVWRQLKTFEDQNWAQELLSQLFLDNETLEWAKEGFDAETDIVVKDSNGAILTAGDSVTLIKDLVVKGAGFTAKRGTLVKNISLTDNPIHIEGRVNGTQIVLVTDYLKKVT